MDEVLSGMVELVWWEFMDYDNWTNTLNEFTGKDTIPMMTIHKSKDLEYDVVFFSGLENSAFISYDRQPYEENCTFFVVD